MDRPVSLRIVLIGKTGSGKSATGNTLLGREEFKEGVFLKGATKTCQKRKAVVSRRHISVIDTPEITDSSMTEEEQQAELLKCFYLSSPGPHVFLLVIRLEDFTELYVNTVEWIQINFGKDAARYIIILFTHVDQLKGKTLDKYITERPDLQDLIHTNYMGRYHTINNNNRGNKDQVTALLKMMDGMVKENRGEYTNDMFEEAERWRKLMFSKEGRTIEDLAVNQRESPDEARARVDTEAAEKAREDEGQQRGLLGMISQTVRRTQADCTIS